MSKRRIAAIAGGIAMAAAGSEAVLRAVETTAQSAGMVFLWDPVAGSFSASDAFPGRKATVHALKGEGAEQAADILRSMAGEWRGSEVLVLAGHNDCGCDAYMAETDKSIPGAPKSSPRAAAPGTPLPDRQLKPSFADGLCSGSGTEQAEGLEQAYRDLYYEPATEILRRGMAGMRLGALAGITGSRPPAVLPQDRAGCLGRVGSAVGEMAGISEEAGIRLTVLTYPVPKEEWEMAMVPELKSPAAAFVTVNAQVNQELRTAAYDNGLRLADLGRCMSKAPRSDWLQDGHHISIDGTPSFAECLERELDRP